MENPRGIRQLPRRLSRVFGDAEKFFYLSGLRSAGSLTLPDFLGIGFMKSGTTWLYENLRVHPEVYVSERKELRYFNNPGFARSLRSYAENFREGHGRTKGEFSPSYATLPSQRIRFIRAVMADVRLLLLMRNPMEREWSRVVHAITRSGRAVEEVPEAEVMGLLGNSKILRSGGYTGIIDRWLQVFPAEQLFLGLYEDIKSRPRELLEEVFEHIGVSRRVDWNDMPYNEVIVPPNQPQHQHLDRGWGVRVKDHQSSSSYFPERYREFLAEAYRDDILALKRHLGGRELPW